MQCPKCGNQNPDDAQSCRACHAALTNIDTQEPKAKTSKLAIFSLILGVSSLFFFVFTGIPAIIIGIVSYNLIKYSDGKLKGSLVSIVGIILTILFMCGFILLWSRDAPPIPNDYTIADLHSAPADCAASYDLLKILTDPKNNLIEQYPDSNTPDIGLSETDIDIINEISVVIGRGNITEISESLNDNVDTIQQAWGKTGKAREIIDRLYDFPEIADLYEPGHTTKPIRMFPLINLSELYQAYAHIQTEPDVIHSFTTELIELDAVFRKLSLNARLSIIKLCCHIIMSINNLTANAIANKPETSRESIELLAEHFTPFTKEQMSLKNSALFEYLSMKFIILEAPKELKSAIKKTPFLKANSTLRVYRNHCEDLINAAEDMNDTSRERLAVWPNCYPFKEPTFPKRDERMPFLYRCYNPTGSMLLKMINLDIFKTMPEKSHRIQDPSNLLYIVLNKRLGKDVDLTNDKYIIDIENKIIFSPGPDGKAGTDDDISLPINPEVLGFTE